MLSASWCLANSANPLNVGLLALIGALLVFSLPDPPDLPARFAPFEVISQRALTNLKARIYAESNLYSRRKARNTLQFFVECVRNGLQCLVLAIGFVALLRLARLPAQALRSSP